MDESIGEKINQVMLAEGNERVSHFMQLQELILHKERQLLPTYFSSIITLAMDRSVDIKKLVASFILEACKIDVKYFKDALDVILMILMDDNVTVLKTIISGLSTFFSTALKGNLIDEDCVRKVAHQVLLKKHEKNEGVKTAIIKFIQIVAMNFGDKKFSSELLEVLLSFLRDSEFSTTALTIIINMMTNMVKENESFITIIVPALLDLHETPPAHFSAAQTKSLIHTLKLQLGNIIKIKNAGPFIPLIREVLSEVNVEKKEKRLKVEESEMSSGKRAKVLQVADEKPLYFETAASTPSAPKFDAPNISQIDVTKMPLNFVIDSVFSVLRTVPLAEIEICLKKWKDTGVVAAARRVNDPRFSKSAEREIVKSESQPFVLNVASMEKEELLKMLKSTLKRILNGELLANNFGIRNIWRELFFRNVSLILHDFVDYSELDEIQSVINTEIFDYIFKDFSNRYDLAIAWLNKEWLHDLTLSNELSEEEQESCERYPKLFGEILGHLSKCDESKQKVFTKFILNCPFLIENQLIDLLRNFCLTEDRMAIGLNTLKELILYRQTVRDECLSLFLSFCVSENKELRTTAISVMKSGLIEGEEIRLTFVNYATQYMASIESITFEEDAPENLLFDVHEKIPSSWPEDQAFQYIDLFLGILECDKSLFTQLCNFYNSSSVPVQRLIRKQLYPIAAAIYQREPEFMLSLLKSSMAEWSERLLLRFLVIICDVGKPSDEFVNKIWDLRHEINGKFFVPLLSALDKKRCLASIPLFVDLMGSGKEEDKALFKEVLLRLLDSTSPLNPSEVFIAIHNVPESCSADKIDLYLKRSMDCVQLCLSMPNIFKADIIANSIQIMVDQSVIPTLLMRTVIQSLNVYRQLSNFVLGILLRLANKRAWTNNRLWEGFMRLCKMMQPATMPIIVQLPSLQIEDMISKFPEIKKPLRDYLEGQPPSLRNRLGNIMRLI